MTGSDAETDDRKHSGGMQFKIDLAGDAAGGAATGFDGDVGRRVGDDRRARLQPRRYERHRRILEAAESQRPAGTNLRLPKTGPGPG